MTRLITISLLTISLAAMMVLFTDSALARGHGHKQAAICTTLDTDGNGMIDASEIDGAASALAALDTDKDGQLDDRELHPHRRNADGKNRSRTARLENSSTTGRGAGGESGTQQGQGGRRRGGHRQHPPQPLITAMDTNSDGILDAQEIENAATALLTLDADSSGDLSADEFRPSRDGRGRR